MNRLLLLLALAWLLAACGSAGQSAPSPTRTPRPPAETPAPTAIPTPDPFQGLGASRRVWEATHGKVVERTTSTGSRYDTPAGRFYVEYYDPAVLGSPDDTVSRIEHSYPEPIPLDTARAEAARLLPPDARLLQTTTVQFRHDQGLMDAYASDALTTRLVRQPNVKGDLWHGAPPGRFVVVYRFTEPGRITGWYIQPGQSY